MADAVAAGESDGVAVASTEPDTVPLIALVAVDDADSADDALARIVSVGSSVDVTVPDEVGVADSPPVRVAEPVALRVSPVTVALEVARGDADVDTDAVALLDTPAVDVVVGLAVTREETDALPDARGLVVAAPPDAEPLSEFLTDADDDCSPDAVTADAV